jgi:hypothetical protein
MAEWSPTLIFFLVWLLDALGRCLLIQSHVRSLRGCFDTNVNLPEERSLAEETDETLDVKVARAPDVFEAESSELYGQPAYARLALDTAADTLLGSEAGVDGSEKGLLDLYENYLNPTFARIEQDNNSTRRESDVEAVEQYGGRISEAVMAAQPEDQRDLRSRLFDFVNREMELGDAVNPEELTRADQEIRAAWEDRGRMGSSGSVTSEILNRYGLREAREQQRFNNARALLGQDRAMTVDPVMAITGRSSTAMNPAMGSYGQAVGTNTGPGQFDPFDPYAADLYNTNYNAAVGGAINSANNRTSLMGAGLYGLTRGAFSLLGG